MSYYKPKGDVSWYAPKATIKSRPFAWSTVAESDIIVDLCERYDGDIDKMIKMLRYGVTEKGILKTIKERFKIDKLFTEDGLIFYSEEQLIKYRGLKERRYNKDYGDNKENTENNL